jgi:hypothetical protein
MTVAQIKDLCSQLPFPSRIEPGGASSTYSEWFITKLYRRNRSSGDCSEYQTERDRILVHLAEISAELHGRAGVRAWCDAAGAGSGAGMRCAARLQQEPPSATARRRAGGFHASAIGLTRGTSIGLEQPPR